MQNNELLRKIQELSFAKVETELYLDTHPNCASALSYYKKILAELDEAMTKYQNTVGPMYAEGVVSADRWTWVDGKWPWQIGTDAYSEDK